MSRLRRGIWITYPTSDGLADDRISSIDVAPDGALWFGTMEGVSRYDGPNWVTFTTADGLVDDAVRAIAFAPDGTAWIGTDGGVSRLDSKRILADVARRR